MKGMTTCKVCGRDFALIIEEHYVAQDPQKVGALMNLVNTDRAFQFDAFDCPHCGCQNVLQGRKPFYLGEDKCPCDYGICDECDHVGETKEYDGCDTCQYKGCTCEDEPCKSCIHNQTEYLENYTKEENDE